MNSDLAPGPPGTTALEVTVHDSVVSRLIQGHGRRIPRFDVNRMFRAAKRSVGAKCQLLLGLGLVLPGLALAATPTVEPERVLKELHAIESAALRGEVEPYRLRYEAEVKARPTDVMLKLYLAWCSMASDDVAWGELKKVVVASPELPWSHYGMGRIYLRWRLKDQAEISFRTALGANNKGFYPAQVGLADLLRAAEKHEEAIARYREVLAAHEDAEARMGLGLSLLALGRTAEAKEELERAVDQWADQAEALGALMNLARKADDAKSAVKYADMQVKLRPRDKVARKAAAEIHFALGDKGLAISHYEALVKYGEKDPEVLRRLSELYEDQGNAEGQRKMLSQLVGTGESVDALVKLAALAEARGELEEADKRLGTALVREPKNLAVLLKSAHVKAQREMLVQALELYRSAKEAGASPAELADADGLARSLRLSATPASGNVEQIWKRVNTGLNAFYTERLKENAALGGQLKVKVKVDAQGKVQSVELIEDSVNDPLITGHVYFALKDATYPKQRREPTFEFALSPPLGKGTP